MQIFVKSLQGRTIVLDATPSTKVEDVKELILSREGIPAEEQSLSFGTHLLENELCLAEYGIEQDSTLHLSLSLLGGAKKRKKKNYSTPKKIKHKKKKVKLAVLKFYKVDENGKIHRLRRECPGEQCGAGVFMAAMEDRHYCGKCGYTLVFSKPEDK